MTRKEKKRQALIAACVVGSWWLVKGYASRRTARPIAPRRVLEIRDSGEGMRVRLDAAGPEGKVTWITRLELFKQYTPTSAPVAEKPRAKAPEVNGSARDESAVLKLRAIVREEIAAALAMWATTHVGGQSVRVMVRHECLAAIREAFGESGAQS